MKKLGLIALSLLTTATIYAQEITSYDAYQIKNNVYIEILDIKRVEKYGWDNLEIEYTLNNASEYDLQKVDFLIHLLDKNQEEIGTMELYTFDVPKKSNKTYKNIEVLSPFVNEKFDHYIVETKKLDVITDPKASVVSISSTQDISLK
ncbi:hypothetical protein BFP72_11280 [Reichenbachiella sp. 5M10]|uniref:hypothetical protein n=1 Tax=Reichenbachiella sp. 5M10 TaxID=1889772 RepID=UPI000C15DB42|nr:hypothetical protein [Reichenbachiella sp. 5M10]PIB35934.1 hypothetical protein BFP72_11280 [Reichenbachiella sp. 5M10]